MKLAIILSAVLSTFATLTPDLCDDVFLDASGEPIMDLVGQTLSRHCKWTGPDAPTWHADVCCSFADNAAHCTPTDTRGRCPSSKSKRYCEHGSVASDGAVTCYQTFPDACEAGWCIEAPEIIPVAQMSDMIMCCSAGGACQYVFEGEVFDCQGELLACHHAWVDNDANIECYD